MASAMRAVATISQQLVVVYDYVVVVVFAAIL